MHRRNTFQAHRLFVYYDKSVGLTIGMDYEAYYQQSFNFSSKPYVKCEKSRLSCDVFESLKILMLRINSLYLQYVRIDILLLFNPLHI